MSSPDIKILVACHKPSFVPDNRFLYPIQVGAALAGSRLPGMAYYDDDGDNISEKNRSYSEMTAHYYAWKNIDAEYYGLFHYRRYLAFDPNLDRDDGWGNIAYDRISEEAIEEMRLNEDDMAKLVSGYDLITVNGRRYPRINLGDAPMTIYSEYGSFPYQHREDLDVTLRILDELYPQYSAAAAEYMKSRVAYECNMFIMRKPLYMDYCRFMFDILFEAEKRIDTTWYGAQAYRIYGYLAERLTGVFFHYIRSQGKYACLELPKTWFKETSPVSVIAPVYEDGVPVVLSANNTFSPYLDIMIRSIVANSDPERKYDIIVLYNDITERNRKWIADAAEDSDNISIRFAKVSEYFDESRLFVDQHLSVETYYRLIIPELMPDYGKILYLDCDMVVNSDVAKLYDMDLQGNMIGAAKDIDVAGQVGMGLNDWVRYADETLGLDKVYDYFQAGVLIMDLDRIREHTSSDELIKMATEHDFRCHDQDILNIVCKNKVYYIPQRWNVLMSWEEADGRSRMQIMEMAHRDLYYEYMDARQNPAIVHFAGYQKPWQIGDCDMAEYFWKYARLSPYYPLVIRGVERFWLVTPGMSGEEAESLSKKRRLANKLLPYGSRRREWVKRIYHLLRG